MALQTKRLVALVQHPLVDRAVGRVTNGAAFANRFVFVNERSALRGMTLETGVVRAHERDAAAFDELLQTCAAAFDRFAFVWIVAIRAAHFAFEHGMMVRQLKLRTQIQVTLKTGVRRFARINDLTLLAAGLNVQTSRAVTRFATDVLGVLAFRHQTGV